jgi:hypothetical protein
MLTNARLPSRYLLRTLFLSGTVRKNKLSPQNEARSSTSGTVKYLVLITSDSLKTPVNPTHKATQIPPISKNRLHRATLEESGANVIVKLLYTQIDSPLISNPLNLPSENPKTKRLMRSPRITCRRILNMSRNQIVWPRTDFPHSTVQ